MRGECTGRGGGGEGGGGKGGGETENKQNLTQGVWKKCNGKNKGFGTFDPFSAHFPFEEASQSISLLFSFRISGEAILGTQRYIYNRQLQ